MTKEYLKNRRGVITIITLATILFMLAFLISTYVIIANRRQAQAALKKEVSDIYGENTGDLEGVYGENFAGKDELVPISTATQLLKIGSGEAVVINDKIYIFAKDAEYELQNDIEFKVSDYLSAYPNSFKEETYTGITETTLTNQVTNYETANSTTNPYSVYTAPGTGTYKLEVWGAQGGSYDTSKATGGLGGYSVGTITLEEGDKLYVYVGGAGVASSATTSTFADGGYNGGGNASTQGGTGGGASDIRINGTSLYDRVIVSGGGGGAYSYTSQSGGNGGGTSGSDGKINSSRATYNGKGGTMTSGGAGGSGSGSGLEGAGGSFGIGGDGGASYKGLLGTYSGSAGRWRLVWRRWLRY